MPELIDLIVKTIGNSISKEGLRNLKILRTRNIKRLDPLLKHLSINNVRTLIKKNIFTNDTLNQFKKLKQNNIYTRTKKQLEQLNVIREYKKKALLQVQENLKIKLENIKLRNEIKEQELKAKELKIKENILNEPKNPPDIEVVVTEKEYEKPYRESLKYWVYDNFADAHSRFEVISLGMEQQQKISNFAYENNISLESVFDFILV